MPLKISRAELEVMQTLWKEDNQTASEVHSSVSKHKDWSIRTVKTLLARLVEKHALRTTPEGRRFRYTTAITETDYKTNAAGQFVDRIFSGRAAPLIAHLADSRGLTDEDIADLEKLLEALKK
jgi:predicted transcriptional regulator